MNGLYAMKPTQPKPNQTKPNHKMNALQKTAWYK